MDIKSDYFYGDRAFIDKVLSQFGTTEALSFFKELGIMHRIEDGRVYPISNQASAIADCLRLYLTENAVDFIGRRHGNRTQIQIGNDFYVIAPDRHAVDAVRSPLGDGHPGE